MQMQDYSEDEVNGYFQKLVTGLDNINPYISVKTANSVWGNANVELAEPFRQTLVEKYAAMVSSLDFSDPSSVDKINNWCNETTEGKIPKILESTDPAMNAYLLNSLYFKARWEDEFDKDDTREDDFHTASGATVRANFMHTKRLAIYATNELFSSTYLSYLDDDYSMRFILPHEGVGIDKVIEALAVPGSLQEIVSAGELREVNYVVPRFSVENKVSLMSTLQTLGMENAFSAEADFSAMVSNPDMPSIISDVLQATCLKINEEGSEGAAVTVIPMATSPGPQEQVDFTLNRPFLFLITENGTGTVLFMGKVGRPEE